MNINTVVQYEIPKGIETSINLRQVIYLTIRRKCTHENEISKLTFVRMKG